MRRVLPFLALFLPLGVASPAVADQVTITSGFLHAAGLFEVSPPSTVTGTDGFHLVTTLAVGRSNGHLAPFTLCDGTESCAPGVQLNVGGLLDSSDGGGLMDTTLSLRGKDYQVSGSDSSLVLQPDGLFTVPEFGDSNEVTVTTPFTLTGFFADLVLIERTEIRGRGTATVKLIRPANPDLPGWEPSSVRYDFANPAVVPEPTSMLLLGSGIAGLLAANTRKKTRS